MIKGKKLYVILGLMSVVLSGCGRQEVSYQTETVSTETSESIHEEAANETLKDALGIGEETAWTETVEISSGKVELKTNIEVPDVKDMYALTVSKHYLTTEDKKKITEYFLDADSVRVDKDAAVTKESLQNEISAYEQAIEENKFPELKVIFPMDEYEIIVRDTYQSQSPTNELIAIYENEVQRLTSLVDGSPAYADLDELAADYSADAYRGKKNDVEYSVSFFADESRNRSAWLLQAVDEKSFLEMDVATDEIESFETSNGNNLCKLTQEDAMQQSLDICEDLGMFNMVPIATNDVKWKAGSDTEVNGYVVKLARQIEGLAVDSSVYLDIETYLDGESVKLSYSTECVEICLNDKGLISVFCKGIMNEEEMSEPVKLLEFDQVQEVFRQELKSVERGFFDGWQTMKLSYTRIASETDPDKFTYIPTWRLQINRYATEGPLLMKPHYLWINAIDGSRINMEESGTITLLNGYGLGDYE